MRSIIFCILLLQSISLFSQLTFVRDDSEERASDLVIQLTREFSRELFDANGANWARPLVEATNASVNSRFFSSAYIPRKVDEPYFKIGLHASVGFIPDSRKWMVPDFATQEFQTTDLFQFVNFGSGAIDTAGLALYMLKSLIHDGLNSDQEGRRIRFPERSPTLLGPNVPPTENAIVIDENALENLLNDRIESLPEATRALITDELVSILTDNLQDVPTYFTLPNGSGMNSMLFTVPQIEIGSLWGTELLLRYIPQLDYGENIGEFGFWGVGISHSLSQYFFEADSLRTFDLAIQAAYQNSQLDQVFGETNGTMNAVADILNLNIHGSYNVNDWFDVYAGYQYEMIDINSRIKYFIGVEQQRQLGMLPTYVYEDAQGNEVIVYDPDPDNGYPGDTDPQYTDIGFDDVNHKLVLGAFKQIGPVVIAVDYNISQFDLFSFGIKYVIGQ